MMRVEQKSPQDVLSLLSLFEEKNDRLGYWSDMLMMCAIIGSMINNWETTLKNPTVKFMKEDDMMKRFLFLRDVTERMVIETDRFHKSLIPSLEEEKSEEEERRVGVA